MLLRLKSQSPSQTTISIDNLGEELTWKLKITQFKKENHLNQTIMTSGSMWVFPKMVGFPPFHTPSHDHFLFRKTHGPVGETLTPPQ